MYSSGFLVAEPPLEVFFVAAFLLLVSRLLTLQYFLSSLEKVLRREGETAALTRVLLDSGIVS